MLTLKEIQTPSFMKSVVAPMIDAFLLRFADALKYDLCLSTDFLYICFWVVFSLTCGWLIASLGNLLFNFTSRGLL